MTVHHLALVLSLGTAPSYNHRPNVKISYTLRPVSLCTAAAKGGMLVHSNTIALTPGWSVIRVLAADSISASIPA